MFLTSSIKYAYGTGGTIINSLIGHKFGKLTVIKQKEYDNLKKNYCIKNNIPLIIIPYTGFNKINNDYIVSIVKG